MKKNVLKLLVVLGVIMGVKVVEGNWKKEKRKLHDMSEKHFALFLMMNQWIKVKQAGKKISDYLESKGYNKIAIYGMSFAGETLLDELKDSEIQVVYGIDQNTDGIYADVDIFTAQDSLGEVDAVVVTAVTFYAEIKKYMKEKMDCPILSLEDILYEI